MNQVDRSVAPPPEQAQDPLLYRMVVGALGLVGILVVLGGLVLAALGRDVPQGVVAIGAAGIGALGGLLAPSPRGNA